MDVYELDVFSLKLVIEGYLWYNSVIYPSSAIILAARPVIHNYALTLAAAGAVSDPGYIISPDKYVYPGFRGLLGKYGVYAYPATASRVYVEELLLSMSPSDLLLYKPRSRYALPLQVRVAALAPGTVFESYLLAEPGLFGDREEYVVRLGVKRFGAARLVLHRVSAEPAGPGRVTHPFNARDAVGARVTRTVFPHPAGDVVYGSCPKTILVVGGARLCAPTTG